VFAALDQRVEPFALLIAELRDVFAPGLLLRAHGVFPVALAISIQT
jgi:hypothetical protein